VGRSTNRGREENELNGVRLVHVGYTWSAEEARERRHQLEEAVLRLASFCEGVSKSVWHKNVPGTGERKLLAYQLCQACCDGASRMPRTM
jgi:hypothetical protein